MKSTRVPLGDDCYDFVVVGAGTTGIVLGTRLATLSGARVCLLEAGPPDHVTEGVRKAWRYNELLGSELDYEVPTSQVQAEGRAFRYSQGRVVGGSSSINSWVALPPPYEDLLRWAELAGNGWGPDALASSLELVRETVYMAPTNSPHPHFHAWVEAAVAAGFPLEPLDVGNLASRVGWNPLNARAGIRQSSAQVYLGSSQASRPEVDLRTNAKVVRIRIRPDGVATGVVLVDGTVVRGDQVVLCCGAINTPTLLMKSGVGPEASLSRLEIRVSVNVAEMGQKLRDHIAVPLKWSVRESGVPLETHGFEAKVFGCSSASRNGLPDMVVSLGLYFEADEKLAGVPEGNVNALTTTVYVARPRSSGEVLLHDSVGSFEPIVRHGLFEGDGIVDLTVLADAVTLAEQLFNESGLGPRESMYTRTQPPVDDIRYAASTLFHPAGSRRMGTDSEAVVSPDLKVNGLVNVRIADASIFPTMLSVHPMMTCFVIGQRAAQLMSVGS